jgi:hypothetical protein
MEEVDVRADPAGGRFQLKEGPAVVAKVVVAAI